MARRRNGAITIDVCEVIDAIDDDDLLREVQNRKLIVGSTATDFVPEDDIREAYEELRRGRPAEALAILDRLVNPKWNNIKACEMEFKKAANYAAR